MATTPDNKNTAPKSNGQDTKDQTIAMLIEQLQEQKARNDELSDKVDILYKSGDKNKIKSNTPKKKQLPLIKITTYNDQVVVGWKKMTANKVNVSEKGMTVEQSSIYIISEDGTTFEEIEMKYDDFHTNKQMVEVQTTRVEILQDDAGNAVDTFYHFTYNDTPFRINQIFIN